MVSVVYVDSVVFYGNMEYFAYFMKIDKTSKEPFVNFPNSKLHLTKLEKISLLICLNCQLRILIIIIL